jgi:hypothetical protein
LRIAIILLILGSLVTSSNEHSKDNDKFIVETLDEVTKDQTALIKPADEAQQRLVDRVFQEIENDKKIEKASLLKVKELKSRYKYNFE